MRELYMWGPNPDLDPESIWNYETGIMKSFGKSLYAELTLFFIEGDNMIVNVGPPNGYLNTGKISNRGIEFALNAEASERLKFDATYSYIHMKDPVFATPEHHLFLHSRYQLKNWSFAGSIQYISGLDNDPSPLVNKEEYLLLNARTMYKLSSFLNVFVSAENILGTSYEVNRYYTMPGMTIFSGVNFTF